MKQCICHKCDEKCILDIDECNGSIKVMGNLCERGIKFAKLEINNNNKAVLTTLVRIKGAEYDVVPVKSNKPLDKSIWIECSKALSRLHVGAPIKCGDIVCTNILNTGVDIICTKNMNKRSS